MRLIHASGATEEEIARALPGDDLVPDATVAFDRAATIPGDVWPWLVQLGKGRAGWYLPRPAERVIPPSRRGLRRLDPSLQHLELGSDHADWGPGDPVLRVAVFDPPHAIAYLSLRDTKAGHRWPADESAEHVLALSWALVRTDDRLHLRLRVRARSSALAAVGGLFDWATVQLLFAGLRERV